MKFFLSFCFFHMDVQLSQHYLLKRIFSYHCIVFEPLLEINWHMCICFSTLFCSNDLPVYLYANTTLSWLLHLYNKSSNIIPLFQNFIGYSRSFAFPYKQKNQLCQFLQKKKSVGILIGLIDGSLEEDLKNTDSLDPWAWYISPVICVLLNFFLNFS